MGLPKGIKEKVGIIALRDAAKADFSGDSDEVDEEDPEEVMEQYCCPKCKYEGSKEEFLTEGD